MKKINEYNAEGTPLRKAQKRMLEILIHFDKICTKYNIDYWLSDGTLLGAKRHAGFIPWDDDLDVQVHHKDYSKLLNILEKELPSEYKLQTHSTDKNYWFFWAKIRDTKSFFQENHGIEFKYNGIFIDILPVEPVPSLKFKYLIDYFLIKFRTRRNANTKFKTIIFSSFITIIPFIHLIIFVVRSWYKVFKAKIYSNSYGIFFYPHHSYSDYLMPLKKIVFEGKLFNAPQDTNYILQELFGTGYMDIPPIEKRRFHTNHIEFYND